MDFSNIAPDPQNTKPKQDRLNQLHRDAGLIVGTDTAKHLRIQALSDEEFDAYLANRYPRRRVA